MIYYCYYSETSLSWRRVSKVSLDWPNATCSVKVTLQLRLVAASSRFYIISEISSLFCVCCCWHVKQFWSLKTQAFLNVLDNCAEEVSLLLKGSCLNHHQTDKNKMWFSAKMFQFSVRICFPSVIKYLKNGSFFCGHVCMGYDEY